MSFRDFATFLVSHIKSEASLAAPNSSRSISLSEPSISDSTLKDAERHRLAVELASFFHGDTPLTDYDFDSISTYMRRLKYPVAWSDNPKLYYILQKLGHADYTRQFFDAGLTDLWLPIPERTLRRLLSQNLMKAFKSIQSRCLNDSITALPERRHLSAANMEDMGFQDIAILGSGGYGEVYSVKSIHTEQLYAMKTMSRPGVHSQHLDMMKNFAKELAGLRRVQHHHCVRLVASGTDINSLLLICSPVADMDLSSFLESDLDQDGIMILQNSVGCITAALAYLHSMNMRHDDLKPNNILVHGQTILLTDFGFSLDFSDSGVSTTTGPAGHFVRRYSAPEVWDQKPRSRLTDIWCLGCVLFEILARMYGYKLSDLRKFWQSNGTHRDSFAENSVATKLFLIQIQPEEGESSLKTHYSRARLVVISFIHQILLEPDRLLRPSAEQVLDKLKDIDRILDKTRLVWVKACCYGQTTYEPQYITRRMRLPVPYTRNQWLTPVTVSPKPLPWGIMDLGYLHSVLATIYMDVELNILGYGGYLGIKALVDPQAEPCTLEDIIAYPRDLIRIRQAANVIVSMANIPSMVSEKQLLGAVFSKSVFINPLNTPGFVEPLHVWKHPKEGEPSLPWRLAKTTTVKRLVQLTLVRCCIERHRSYGNVFFVLAYDPFGSVSDPWK